MCSRFKRTRILILAVFILVPATVRASISCILTEKWDGGSTEDASMGIYNGPEKIYEKKFEDRHAATQAIKRCKIAENEFYREWQKKRGSENYCYYSPLFRNYNRNNYSWRQMFGSDYCFDSETECALDLAKPLIEAIERN